jgi:Zn-dependent metalloprotease
MKTTRLFFIVLILFASSRLGAQVLTGSEAEKQVRGSEAVLPGEVSSVPKYVKFKDASAFSVNEFPMWTSTVLGMSKENSFKLLNTTPDKLGFIHYRYQQYYNNIPVEGTMYILHSKDGKVKSMNGELLNDISTAAVASIDESTALANALSSVNATTYKWQIPAEENYIKQKENNPAASFFPKGELVYVSSGKLNSQNLRLAWKFDVYADKPLSRDYIYVDALTGQILLKKNRIHTTDTPGIAVTAYSGNQPIITDNFSGGYRLQESGRGGGLRTFDMQTGTNYGNAVDFTDADNTWNNVNPQGDQYATDAHWGAEMTYDYYWLMHNRNSIDDNGFQLDSYVHYDVNYQNAFWDGTRMTYGDGNATTNPFTALDIAGHEISHGLTEFTSALDYQDESGALNESFSDIFGTCIEFYGRPSNANWLMGSDIGYTIRNMANPNSTGDPDTYTGTNWYVGAADNGGVHTNSNVQNYWFYLLTMGGTGTNDLGNPYTVTGIGMANAADIAFRTNTVYLTSTSQYADSRFYSIQSAIDLFGACTPEVIATTNAWHAVGVGGIFVFGVNVAFTANVTSGCSVPFTVNFTNGSSNAGTFLWNFGDATTSTQNSPSHTYTNFGTYTVSLVGDGGACGIDSATQPAYIILTDQSPSAPGATVCKGGTATLTATGTPVISWYANSTGGLPLATGNTYTTPPIYSSTNYYIESTVPGTPGNLGPVNAAFGPGSYHNSTSTQYLEFDVYQPCTLLTAWVDAGAAGSRNFQLWDGAGNLIQTYMVNCPAGQSTITLNIPLTPGSYRIGGTQMDLYRNSAGAAFPYPLNGVASITGASASGRYYYLYNWTIQPQCVTNRIPVPVTLGFQNQALFTYTNTANTYNFNSSATTATQWWWNFGDGSPVVTAQNPAHTFLTTGPYTVQLVVTDGTCYDSSYQVVNVVDGITELTGSISGVYPNPATNELHVISQSVLENFTAEIYDVLGQKVFTSQSQTANKPETVIDISTLLPGVYNIEILSGGNRSSGRFVKQ